MEENKEIVTEEVTEEVLDLGFDEPEDEIVEEGE